MTVARVLVSPAPIFLGGEDLIEGSERVREDGIEGLENCGCRAGVELARMTNGIEEITRFDR